MRQMKCSTKVFKLAQKDTLSCDGIVCQINLIILTLCKHMTAPDERLLYFLLSGFKEQIYDVYRYLPPATQVCLISATLPHEILEMTNKFMTDPIRILVKR